MSKSGFLSAKQVCYIGLLMGAALCLSFTYSWNKQQAITWGNQCLLQAFDPLSEPKMKRWDLTLTAENFIRLKKVYVNGKQEYYSLNLKRFSDMDYLGTTTNGIIRIKTKADDIIVQTYNDPKGNVDSMATALKIPVRDLTAERLDSLLTALNYLKHQ